jgi:hypothetical protein
LVYHAAAQLDDLAAAQRLVEAARAEAMEHAGVAMHSLQAALPAGHRLPTAGIVQSNARLPDSPEAILRAHPLLHTAEGVLFRKVLAQACGDLRLPVLGVPSRELGAAAAALLGVDPGELPVWLAAAGRGLGRPWGKDEKDALQVATRALAAAPR